MPRLTDDQVNEAIEQMKVHARLAVEANKAGGEYQFLSARGTLHELGYDGDAADVVITAVYDRGFTHCLDPMFLGSDPDTKETYHVSADACYWGADQLLSRLDALRR